MLKKIGIPSTKITTYDKNDFYKNWKNINRNLSERWDNVIKYNPHHTIKETFTDRYLISAIIKRLDNWLPKKRKGKKFLKFDLYNEATGTAKITDWLMSQGYDYYGVDISKEVVIRAKKNFGKKINPSHMKIGDVRNLPYRDNFFDVVWSYGTIEHIRENQEACDEAFRVLKPGGIFITGVNNRLDMWGSYFVNEFTNTVFKHITSYEASFFPWQQRNWLKKSGFVNITTTGSVMFPHGIRYLDLFLEWKLKFLFYKLAWNYLVVLPWTHVAKFLDEIAFLRFFGTHTTSIGFKPVK